MRESIPPQKADVRHTEGMSAPYRLRGLRPQRELPVDEVLGPRVRSYYAAANSKVIWAAAPFVLLLAYGVWLGHQGLLSRWFNSTFSAVAVSTLFVLCVALITRTSAVGGAEVLRVHANGLLDLRAGPRAVRWDEMRSLTAVTHQADAVVEHCLRTSDGTMVKLGESIGEVMQLVDELRVRMVEHKLPGSWLGLPAAASCASARSKPPKRG